MSLCVYVVLFESEGTGEAAVLIYETIVIHSSPHSIIIIIILLQPSKAFCSYICNGFLVLKEHLFSWNNDIWVLNFQGVCDVL